MWRAEVTHGISGGIIGSSPSLKGIQLRQEHFSRLLPARIGGNHQNCSKIHHKTDHHPGLRRRRYGYNTAVCYVDHEKSNQIASLIIGYPV